MKLSYNKDFIFDFFYIFNTFYQSIEDSPSLVSPSIPTTFPIVDVVALVPFTMAYPPALSPPKI